MKRQKKMVMGGKFDVKNKTTAARGMAKMAMIKTMTSKMSAKFLVIISVMIVKKVRTKRTLIKSG